MTRRRLVVVGTGTDIGKTHVSCALIRAWGERRVDAIGLKPIETGVIEGASGPSDQMRLWEASQAFHVKRGGAPTTFHVKRALYTWPDPISPHLAARRAGVAIDVAAVRQWVDTATAQVTVIETAGGLFSPLAPGVSNFDLSLALRPTAVLLVAPDRLGVLHDVTATLGLALSRGLPLSAVALSAPAKPDGSTGANASELASLGIATPLAVFPRAPDSAPESRAAASAILDWFDKIPDA